MFLSRPARASLPAAVPFFFPPALPFVSLPPCPTWRSMRKTCLRPLEFVNPSASAFTWLNGKDERQAKRHPGAADVRPRTRRLGRWAAGAAVKAGRRGRAHADRRRRLGRLRRRRRLVPASVAGPPLGDGDRPAGAAHLLEILAERLQVGGVLLLLLAGQVRRRRQRHLLRRPDARDLATPAWAAPAQRQRQPLAGGRLGCRQHARLPCRRASARRPTAATRGRRSSRQTPCRPARSSSRWTAGARPPSCIASSKPANDSSVQKTVSKRWCARQPQRSLRPYAPARERHHFGLGNAVADQLFAQLGDVQLAQVGVGFRHCRAQVPPGSRRQRRRGEPASEDCVQTHTFATGHVPLVARGQLSARGNADE